jgi:hypothetical protein
MCGVEDETKVPRVIGIFLSWGAWLFATMNLPSVVNAHVSLGKQIAVSAGFILGNFFYTQLWIAEGRARERARCRLNQKE